MVGNRIAKIAREIVRLSQQQLDLLEAVPIEKWTEAQAEGYRRRQQLISQLSAEIMTIKLSPAA